MSEPLTVGDIATHDGWWMVALYFGIGCVGTYHIVRYLAECAAWIAERRPRNCPAIKGNTAAIGFGFSSNGVAIFLWRRSLTFGKPVLAAEITAASRVPAEQEKELP